VLLKSWRAIRFVTFGVIVVLKFWSEDLMRFVVFLRSFLFFFMVFLITELFDYYLIDTYLFISIFLL
jgi:hypothetical protein